MFSVYSLLSEPFVFTLNITWPPPSLKCCHRPVCCSFCFHRVFFFACFFAKSVCISSLGKEAKRFVGRVDLCFLKVFCLNKSPGQMLVQNLLPTSSCQCFPSPFDNSLIWPFNIIFSRIFHFFEMFSRGFSLAPSRSGARKAASQKGRCTASVL